MNVHLMFPCRDLEVKRDFEQPSVDVKSDLELDVLLDAMANKDSLIYNVAQSVLLDSFAMDVETVKYRQSAAHDVIENAAVVKALYELSAAAIEGKRHFHFGIFINFPSGILHGSLDLMNMLVDVLRKARLIADTHRNQFASAAFVNLFEMFQAEFDDAYFAEIEAHLAYLKLKGGVLESAQLGPGNEGIDYVLRQTRYARLPWLDRLLHRRPAAFTFRIADRDEAGARALSELRDRGLNLVANAMAQSTEHILSFFEMLRTELAFYIGCLNLMDQLDAIGAVTCFPNPIPSGDLRQTFQELYDPCLALRMGKPVVGNAVDIGARSLIVITGANQGGKSSFLRSVGVAQLMMQAGMFVGAQSFSGSLCSGLFTHYKREEDATMASGKFDEELRRMSRLVDGIKPGAILLFNESFASTNEREGSEIAHQIVAALLEHDVRVYFVTHLYDFAAGARATWQESAVFLRAERQPDGSRTFQLKKAEPLDTSYGEDVYREVFSDQEASTL